MSKHKRRQQMQESFGTSESLLATVEQQMAEGYLEVELVGLSFRRLIAVYSVLVRNTWGQTVGAIRSLLRPDPALEG